jgi:hypothetical protein
MTEDDTPLRDEILRLLTATPVGIGDLSTALNLSTNGETVALAATLHALVKEGSIAAERAAGIQGRPLRYRALAPGEAPALPPPRKGKKSSGGLSVTPPKGGKQSTPKAQPEPREQACAAIERAIEALVPDPAVMVLVKAYGALREGR